MPRRSTPPGYWIGALLLGALSVVLVLAMQAKQNLPGHVSQTGDAKPTAKSSPPLPPEARYPVPPDTGMGRRVVYSKKQQRVWLIAENEQVLRTFRVWPGTIDPAVGAHTVTYRRAQGTGTDGAMVENVVYFGSNYAFSNAVDGSPPKPSPGLRTGAIRESVADGRAMWKFASENTSVYVAE